ncbi:MAG TPA: 2-succinyl-5-enolpyruvyl-6-hydroxy-3-cyclohexene-1-carboxylic-acid synthase [Solirubrobacteraceae bacterium]|nr:2-succinyl-5-enolpyruvyl-6-hydroxy-3-cyclohexene-1-carboxylic-acid synthase [Solirubrobacteraceae bacterium]
MSQATDTYVLLRAFVDELVRSGMRAACTSPGSRSAPLALTLAREPRLRCFSHIDERSSGFFALGLAKASGLPVAVTCTSGTAAAELLPAAIEAHEARVPLLLLTADRPPELRENGAGQAIDQLKLYGSAAKWFFEVGTHEATPERLRWIRTLACRAYATALEGRAGVVHLNFPLREPLVTDEPLPDDASARADGAPYVLRAPLTPGSPSRQIGFGLGRCAEPIDAAQRGVVVAGRDERQPIHGQPSVGQLAAAFAATRGWPLLADPMSGARRGASAIAHYDALLRDEAFASSVAPDLVLRVGDLPVSKPLRNWLAGLGETEQVALDPDGAWQDPSSVLSSSLALDPVLALRALTSSSVPSDPQWLARWRSADELASEAIFGVMRESGLSEPAIAAELGVLLPEDATLFVSSSMPVRDIETFWPARSDLPRVLCNRGANGIDGVVSSAFGAAAAGAGPVVLLIGDVALAHDLGGLLASKRLALKLTIVLLNNGGGGIFDFLPVAESRLARVAEPPPEAERDPIGAAASALVAAADRDGDVYTHHIATPTGLDFADAARLYAVGHERAADVSAFRRALERALAAERSTIVEVRTDRDANVQLHRKVWSTVSHALDAQLD